MSPFCLTNVGDHTKLKGFDLAKQWNLVKSQNLYT